MTNTLKKKKEFFKKKSIMNRREMSRSMNIHNKLREVRQ